MSTYWELWCWSLEWAFTSCSSVILTKQNRPQMEEWPTDRICSVCSLSRYVRPYFHLHCNLSAQNLISHLLSLSLYCSWSGTPAMVGNKNGKWAENQDWACDSDASAYRIVRQEQESRHSICRWFALLLCSGAPFLRLPLLAVEAKWMKTNSFFIRI